MDNTQHIHGRRENNMASFYFYSIYITVYSHIIQSMYNTALDKIVGIYPIHSYINFLTAVFLLVKQTSGTT